MFGYTKHSTQESMKCRHGRIPTVVMMAALLTLVAAACGSESQIQAAATDSTTAPTSTDPTTTAPTTTTVASTTSSVVESTVAAVAPSDVELAGAALVESSELDPLLNAAPLNASGDLWLDAVSGVWQGLDQLMRSEPDCADHTAALDAAGAPTAGVTGIMAAVDSWEFLSETVTVYENVDVASQVMDAMEEPEFQNCLPTFWSTALASGATDGEINPTSTLTEVAAPIQAGDRQLSFGVTTENGTDPRGPVLYHVVYAQFDRAVVGFAVSEDGLGPQNPRGFVQLILPVAVTAAEDALAEA